MKTETYDFTKKYHDTIIKKLGNDLKNGSIGIFPTDTVYGIGCNAFNEESILKIFNIKNRNYNKPINVLISDLEMLNLLVKNISNEEYKLIKAFWPGALTIIFNKENDISNLLTSNLNTIGVRIPNNNTAISLIKEANIPLATTSVNISGKPPGISSHDFIDCFTEKVDFIIDEGPTNLKYASTIVQIIDGKPIILRKGSITKKQIENILLD